MPVISFANPKGGAGKTTCALLLAGQIAHRGGKVCIIDADPERWISQWLASGTSSSDISVKSVTDPDMIIDTIIEASQRFAFVIVDLEGTASLAVAQAVGLSNLVLIPLQGASMDAKGAAKTIRLIESQSKMLGRQLEYRVVLTRTNAALMTRSLRNVRAQLDAAGVPVLSTPIVERAAYRDIFDFGLTLTELDGSATSNHPQAIQNAEEFLEEVITLLGKSGETE
ncbi:ParA family protein [Yoonia sediminilitoris]|uniref:Chromosome partitioning protein n=1 Tax=Yoonia sediminilitoris TaxID=1286148 RepID=A0A2T6KF16_9RHOB|nr:ParA family protein [Yoonia sediminilitoris]PUB13725.1 chromosome partitioning protein [Yoonia sediminilitoris]RCW94895.1 chromosome partitioning protein [Yoonia sediminilitoris]